MFLCPLFSPIYLYCSPVMKCCHFNVIFNIVIKARGLACHKTRFNPPFFFLKCTVSHENGHCYIIVRFCVCYILMLCFCCVVILLYLMRFPQFYFVTRICSFLNRFMNFKQRYTNVAFIYVIFGSTFWNPGSAICSSTVSLFGFLTILS